MVLGSMFARPCLPPLRFPSPITLLVSHAGNSLASHNMIRDARFHGGCHEDRLTLALLRLVAPAADYRIDCASPQGRSLERANALELKSGDRRRRPGIRRGPMS